MIDELREYQFTEQAWERYWQLFQTCCLPIRGNDYGALLGMWQEQVDNCIYFSHVWRYQSFDERTRLRAELGKVKAWREAFLPQAAPLVSRQFLQLLNPRSEVELCRARFVHSYRCATGTASAVIDRIHRSVDASGQPCCGVWTTEFSDPNQVLVMTAGAQTPLSTLEAAVSIESRRIEPLMARSS